VLPIGDTSPANEAQARELVPLRDDPEQMAEAWTEAQEAAEAEVAKVINPHWIDRSRDGGGNGANWHHNCERVTRLDGGWRADLTGRSVCRPGR